VQLESDAFLTDIDFMNMSSAQRGVCCSLILYLTSNKGKWLVAGCESGRFDGEIFARVLDLARQARQGNNPAGLLMAMLKKELGYGDQGRKQE